MVYANKTRDELFVTDKMKTKTSEAVLPFHKRLQEILLK